MINSVNDFQALRIVPRKRGAPLKLPLLCGLLVSAALAAAPTPGAAPVQAPPALSFRIDEERNINSFLRDGPVAAHLLLRSGTEPRILVLFPAGNSGVCL